MPTGYTSFIEDEKIKTGKDFLMLCARAMGACISMRDDPLSAPIPELFVESEYCHGRLLETQDELKLYQKMTLKEAQNELDDEYIKNQADCQAAIDRCVRLIKAYSDVRKEVSEWMPPTDQHKGLKKFALEQIDMCAGSIDPSFWEERKNKPKQNAADWLKEKIECLEKDKAYYENEWQSEKDRVQDRNNWIRQLRESFYEKKGGRP